MSMSDLKLTVSANRPARSQRVVAAALALVALSLAGCGNIEPWVKPYERQNLADPVMSFDLNPVSSAYLGHVYESREGSRGALGGAGGGCGCN
jgi:DNA primase